MKLLRLSVFAVYFSLYIQKSTAGIFAIKAQNLFALKQAIIASKLPIGQQIVLLPALAAATTTRRPNVTVPTVTTARPATTVTTARPATTVTTARPAVTTTTTTRPTSTTPRPSTVIGIQQWFPGVQYYPTNQQFPSIGMIQFPGGQLPGGIPAISEFPVGQQPGGIQFPVAQQPGGGQFPVAQQPGGGQFPVGQQPGGGQFPVGQQSGGGPTLWPIGLQSQGVTGQQGPVYFPGAGQQWPNQQFTSLYPVQQQGYPGVGVISFPGGQFQGQLEQTFTQGLLGKKKN